MGTSASTRWLAGAGAALVLIVIAAVAVGIAARGEQTFPAGAPEGTVQQYLRAVLDRDVEAAVAYLEPELRERCDQAGGRNVLRDSIRPSSPRDFRASLRDTRMVGDVTEVDVQITETWGEGPFDSGEYSQEQIFTLQQVDGEWRFVEPPWPVYSCPEPAIPAPGL